MLPPAASGQISGEQFKRRYQNLTFLSGTIWPGNLSDTTSPATTRRLQNASRHCTKLHKTGAAGKSRSYDERSNAVVSMYIVSAVWYAVRPVRVAKKVGKTTINK